MTHEGGLKNTNLTKWTLQLESEKNTDIKDLTSEIKADVALLNNVTNKLSSLFAETEVVQGQRPVLKASVFIPNNSPVVTVSHVFDQLCVNILRKKTFRHVTERKMT